MESADPEAWGQVIDINLKGVFHGMHAVLPVMLGQGGGSIITISSGAAHNPLEGWSHYCASKAAVAMLTRCLHLEHGAAGIRAMGLSPGTVATQMQKEIKASGVNPVSQLDWSDHIPPEWPAVALSWMCSPESDGHLGEEISLAIARHPGDAGARRMIRVDRDGPLWTVTIDRPDKANSLTGRCCRRSPMSPPRRRRHRICAR
jgi:NAD(P)-dependent dehydrogenase (short-subunit alcohol dehydrogenase family)